MMLNHPPRWLPAASSPVVARRPGTMWDDYALQRAVSVIMWALIQHHDDATAMAKAQVREPQLTDREIRLAWQWAHAGIRAAALLREAGPDDTLADVLDRAGVPWRQVQ